MSTHVYQPKTASRNLGAPAALSQREATAAQARSDAATHASSAVYYPWFDWLRIILAAAVVLSHAEILTGEHSGNFPVQVFFALSGWLIGGILLRTEPAAMLRFYYLRATRIWIPYAVAFALLLGVSLMRDTVTPKYLEFVFYKATFVYNLFGPSQLEAHAQDMPLHAAGNHFWSICAEEQFYLIAPLFLVFWPKVGRTLAFWIVLLVGLAALGSYGSISAGVLAAVAQQQFGDWHRKPVAQAVLAVVAAASAALMLTEVLPYVQTVPLLAISIVLLAARAGRKQTMAGFLGGVSYPLYLNHWLGLFIGHAVAKRLGIDPELGEWTLGLPLAFALSALLYVTIDRAIVLRRNQWYSERLGRAMTIAAYGLMVIGLLGGAYFHAVPQAGSPPAAGQVHASHRGDGASAGDSTINAALIR